MLISDSNVKITRDGGVITAYVSGEIDHHNAKSARRRIDRELETSSPEELILDLSAVSFMDSSGLGVVLGRYKLLKERGGSMRIRGASRPVGRILKMAGVYALLGQQDAERGEGHVG